MQADEGRALYYDLIDFLQYAINEGFHSRRTIYHGIWLSIVKGDVLICTIIQGW